MTSSGTVDLNDLFNKLVNQLPPVDHTKPRAQPRVQKRCLSTKQSWMMLAAGCPLDECQPGMEYSEEWFRGWKEGLDKFTRNHSNKMPVNGVCAFLLREIGVEYEYDTTNRDDGLALWIANSNGILITQARKFYEDFAILPPKVKGLSSDQAATMLTTLFDQQSNNISNQMQTEVPPAGGAAEEDDDNLDYDSDPKAMAEALQDAMDVDAGQTSSNPATPAKSTAAGKRKGGPASTAKDKAVGKSSKPS